MKILNRALSILIALPVFVLFLLACSNPLKSEERVQSEGQNASEVSTALSFYARGKACYADGKFDCARTNFETAALQSDFEKLDFEKWVYLVADSNLEIALRSDSAIAMDARVEAAMKAEAFYELRANSFLYERMISLYFVIKNHSDKCGSDVTRSILKFDIIHDVYGSVIRDDEDLSSLASTVSQLSENREYCQ
jgi:hypothetical protein